MNEMLPPLTASPNVNPFSFDRQSRTPYVSQWSFGAQHTFQRDYLVEVEYVGSTGQKQAERRNLNSAAFDPGGTIPLAARRPYPQFGNILLAYHGGWSSYNAMTSRIEKRFGGGLYFLTSYTWQKSLDLGSTDEFSAVGSSFKILDKGHSSFDVPHRLVFSYVYELPFGKGKHFAGSSGHLWNTVIGGWQVSGITTFSKGQFQTPSVGVDWLNIGSFNASRPNIVGDYTAGRSFPDAFVGAAAFDYPRNSAGQPIHVPGNAARNSIEQPGINNWDMGVFKNTSIHERMNLQFRWETFNTWNHTQYGPANLSMTSVNLGKITGLLVGPRRTQFGLRLRF